MISKILVAVAGTLAAVQPAMAARIHSPVSVTANTMGEFSSSFRIAYTIDGSGLSSGFTSGVTDFGAYIATNPRHSDNQTGVGFGSPNTVTSGTVDYDLGQPLDIRRLALWPDDNHGPSNLTVFTADNAAFTNATNVGTFTPPPVAGTINNLVPAHILDLTDSTNRFLRLQIQSSHSNFIVSFGEVAVDGAVVPEPSSLFVAALGLAGTLRRRPRAHS